ncbi:heavy metal translocating P-type ATPase [Helicobacter sp. 11S02596-1]|uniref:heavy metal translocating P-type ATPase n=1 Tax=Helicobacter sp. 11S02596-1 TaxID=1476194 RepID=UPI000BA5A3BC|nr:heavy metal translocating P-type ATPase [Helicobacter sp. 11S02596-1]PAF43594.1 cadmium-translocating P-type ATPase [Helicobacter sp. 11S02596-1]
MQKYHIHNMDCPSCAEKIERELAKLPYVTSAQVSFSTNTLLLETSDFASVQTFLKKLEPNILLTKKENTSQDSPAPISFVPIISTIALFFLSIIALHFFDSKPVHIIAQTILLGVYFYAGKDVFLGAYHNFKRGQFFDENILMLTATIAAFFIGAYEEAVSVMVFFATGEFLQDLAVSRSKNSIKALLDVAPDIAYIKQNNTIIPTTPANLKINDVLIVKAGEKIPTDGIVLAGKSTLDQKALTGESIPISVQAGQKVLGGSINLDGVLEISVEKLYEDSSVAKIIELVQNATNKKSRTEKFITSFARYYTPIVFFIAIFVAVFPPLAGIGSFEDWIYRGLVVLMVSCPCALVISIPLGYFGGIGAASKNGILIKGANYLEALAQVKNIAFDKTGTLTKGVFKVTQIIPEAGFSKEDVLRYANCSQTLSNHPIATSIKQAYKDHHTHDIKDYEELSGYGIKTKCGADLIIAGNDKILHKYNIPHDKCHIKGTVVHIAANQRYIGHIIISDEIKDDAKEGFSELRSLGIAHMRILSGDNAHAVKEIATTLHCDYDANLLPEEKLQKFEAFKTSHPGKTAFVGDGINDAPTLASADVGISMGGASDVSKESADIIITNNAITSIAKAFKIAKKTKTIIWQNIFFALGIKAVFIVLGLFGLATLWEAVFGDVGVALIALANAMRVMRA